MNYRLHVFAWRAGQDPDQSLAHHLTTYDQSEYLNAYLEFLKATGKGKPAQLILIDLDNRKDHVVLYDSRDEI